MDGQSAGVKALLQRAGCGDVDALDAVFPLVYAELRRLAALQFRGDAAIHTLSPTGLVHEAWLRIAGAGSARWMTRQVARPRLMKSRRVSGMFGRVKGDGCVPQRFRSHRGMGLPLTSRAGATSAGWSHRRWHTVSHIAAHAEGVPLMRTKVLLFTVIASLALPVVSMAQATAARPRQEVGELRADRREIRRDRREIRGDHREIRGDRRELRGTVRKAHADRTVTGSERREIRRDRRDLRRDQRDVRRDTRDLRADRRDLRRDLPRRGRR